MTRNLNLLSFICTLKIFLHSFRQKSTYWSCIIKPWSNSRSHFRSLRNPFWHEPDPVDERGDENFMNDPSRWRIILNVRQRNSSNMQWSGCRSWGMLFISFFFCKGKLTPMLSMIFFYFPKKKDAMCNFAPRSLYTFEYNWPLSSNLNLF